MILILRPICSVANHQAALGTGAAKGALTWTDHLQANEDVPSHLIHQTQCQQFQPTAPNQDQDPDPYPDPDHDLIRLLIDDDGPSHLAEQRHMTTKEAEENPTIVLLEDATHHHLDLEAEVHTDHPEIIGNAPIRQSGLTKHLLHLPQSVNYPMQEQRTRPNHLQRRGREA